MTHRMRWRNPAGNKGHAWENSHARKANHDRNAIHDAIDGYVVMRQPERNGL
jgi:hypothetical protein